MFQVNSLLGRGFSARQRIHMKYQALFSSKDKNKKLKCRLLQFFCGALRVNGKLLTTFRTILHLLREIIKSI